MLYLQNMLFRHYFVNTEFYYTCTIHSRKISLLHGVNINLFSLCPPNWHSLCVYIKIHVYKYKCIYKYIYTCMCIYMCVCIYIHCHKYIYIIFWCFCFCDVDFSFPPAICIELFLQNSCLQQVLSLPTDFC